MSKTNGTNQLIFPSLLVSSVLLASTTGNSWFWLVAIYFLLVLCCKRQWRLLAVAVFCGFFCLWRLSYWPTLELGAVADETCQLTCMVEGNTIEINGDKITFDAWTTRGNLAVTTYAAKDEVATWRALRNKELQIKGQGVYSKGTPQRNLGGFSYRHYLYAHGYSGSFQIKKILGQKETPAPFSVQRLRGYLISHVETTFPPKAALYLKALLFGHKDGAFQSVAQGFKQTGILHLFSISGLHLWFLFGLVDKWLRRVGLTKEESFFPMVLVLAGGFWLFGGSASVLRATCAVFLQRVLALGHWRLSSLDRFSLVLVGVQLVWPTYLLTTGGQLSLYLAWLLLYVSQRPGKWRQGLWLSLLPAPLLMYLFAEWSWVGGILTVLCVPLFSWLLLPGSLLLLGASLLTPLPKVFLEIVERFFEILGNLLSGGSGFSWITGQPPVFLVIGCLLGGVYLYERRSKWTVMLCVCLPLFVGSFPFDERISFVDVGQGDSIVFRSRGNREVTVLDTGGRLNFKEDWAQGYQAPNSEYTLIPFLKSQGIRRISRLILTHGDVDHMGDAQSLFETFVVEELLLPAGSHQHENIQKLIRLLPEKTVVREILAPERIGGVFSLEVLAPKTVGKGENEDSLVLTAYWKQRRFLFTGDLDQAGERRLLKDYPQLRADVLKIGHHGSRSSTDPVFLQALQVKAAVISSGAKNSFGHPHEEVLTALKKAQVQVWRTDQQGMIYFSSQSAQVSWVRKDWQKTDVSGRIMR